MKQYLVLDFGGTYTKYALMDENGAFLERGKVDSRCEDLDRMLASVAPLKEQFAGQFEGVAVSMPGRIDTANGIAYTGGMFKFIRETPMGAKLETLFGVPVTIANDGKCAASAEAWSGALADVKDGLVIVLGTGTGGGIVLNHEVRMGHSFGAGELSVFGASLEKLSGGMTMGQMGRSDIVLANYLSASGLLRLYGLAKGRENAIPGVDGLQFFEAYDAGEPEAIKTLSEFGRYAAAALYSIQAVLDVEKIAIGGGISARPEVTETIRKAMKRQREIMVFTPFQMPEVVPCKYGNSANLIGALSFHLKRMQFE